MESKLAQEAQEELDEVVRKWTPEERLVAFATHNELVIQLYLAGQKLLAASSHEKP